MSSNSASKTKQLRTWWQHAFAVSPPEQAIAEEDEKIAQKVAHFIVKRQLSAPAIMLLETGRPLNFLGSQFLTFLSPFVSIIFSNTQEFDRFTQFLEKRESISCLIQQIETMENQIHG